MPASMSARAAAGSFSFSARRTNWLPNCSAALNEALASLASMAARYQAIALSTSLTPAYAVPKASATAPMPPHSGANWASR